MTNTTDHQQARGKKNFCPSEACLRALDAMLSIVKIGGCKIIEGVFLSVKWKMYAPARSAIAIGSNI